MADAILTSLALMGAITVGFAAGFSFRRQHDRELIRHQKEVIKGLESLIEMQKDRMETYDLILNRKFDELLRETH